VQTNTNDLVRSKRVLIIDDSSDMLGLLRCVLESKGYGIDCDLNGEAALLRLQSGEPLPDVILLDLQMPVMNGYEFLKIQNDFPELSAIPTIIMTGDETFVADERHVCPEAVLKKPLNISTILDSLKRYSPAH
jgi:CheY-like chemotaxis protein